MRRERERARCVCTPASERCFTTNAMFLATRENQPGWRGFPALTLHASSAQDMLRRRTCVCLRLLCFSPAPQVSPSSTTMRVHLAHRGRRNHQLAWTLDFRVDFSDGVLLLGQETDAVWRAAARGKAGEPEAGAETGASVLGQGDGAGGGIKRDGVQHQAVGVFSPKSAFFAPRRRLDTPLSTR